jgi:hypothetical protein
LLTVALRVRSLSGLRRMMVWIITAAESKSWRSGASVGAVTSVKMR